MITEEEIKNAWSSYKWLIIRWFLVSVTGLLSGVVIANFILKNYLGYKGKLATCNDTKDGDFAPDWFMPKFKRSIITTICWWFRNHSWNFLNAEVPEWDHGKVDEFKIIELTIEYESMKEDNRYNKFTKANKNKGIYGINHYAYRLNGKVFVNYSKATEKRETQLGAGGNEWRCWRKPIF